MSNFDKNLQNHSDYPVEYKEGKVQFFGKDFFVNESVLIPRLETEFLVREARKILEKEEIKGIIDIGTGSGIIGLSLADFGIPAYLVDLSKEALKVAEKNTKNLFPENNHISLIQSDLLKNVQLGNNNCTKNILFIANLPYIKNNDFANMSVDTRFEPDLALFGGEKTGFELYERLFAEIHAIGPQESIGIFEFGFDQKNTAQEILEQYDWKHEFFADHAGIERFVKVWF
ncbi:HemK family protein methyltransferase [Candidatus Gracilibacteria bacterium]|nr:HemK family protein methyltransferase [Candidatus Gracilibacteria bacterium]